MSKPLKERLKAIKPALVVKPPAPVVVVPTPEPGFLELMRDVQPLRPDNRASLPRPLPSPHPRPRNETMACPAAHEAFASWFDEDQSAADFVRNGVPRDIFKRMRTRHWPIASREDLHGHDRDAAEARLLLFLHQASRHGHRMVCVIHGQGFGSADRPVLRPMVRALLSRHPDVLAYCAAPPADGGDGAILVLLRRVCR